MLFATEKKVFTIIEMVVVIGMITGGILIMYSIISHGLNFVDYTRKKLIAINLAREGMEAVYNIRDTNWIKRSGKRDKCWLKANPLVDDGNDGCGNDNWFQSGHYIVKQDYNSNQKYWLLSGVNIGLNIFDKVDASDLIFSLCLSGGLWQACPGQDNITVEGRFFREIFGLGLINKKDGTELTCDKGDSSNCGDSIAKEFRFCSIVQFLGNGKGEVKMCGVLTNFKE